MTEGNGPSPPTPGPSSRRQPSADRSSTMVSTSEEIRARSERLQTLVDRAVAGDLSGEAFFQAVQASGVSADEAEDYIKQLEARLSRQKDKARAQRPDEDVQMPDTEEDRPPNPTPVEGPTRMSQEDLDSLAWGLLASKIDHLRTRYPDWASSSQPRDSAALHLLTNLFSQAPGSQPQPPSTGIPAGVLAGAPHLAEANNALAISDPHIAKTWRLRGLFSSEGAANPIIDFAQQQNLEVPLPRSIWKDILFDKFVNFEKLHAAMELGYDHDDEPKQFIGDLAIVRKDHSSSKKPVRSESDWQRVFDAWSAGVSLLYPHRTEELSNYRKIIREYFRHLKDDAVSIRIDLELRDSYDKERFRLDDRARHQVSVLGQAYRGARGQKRSPPASFSSSPSVAKKPSTVCRNWNLNICHGDTCEKRRRHGVCCECGGQHRAIDEPACRAAFQASLKKRPT